MMTGLGAWSFGFYKYGFKPANARQSAGLRAIKQGLVDSAYSKGIDVEMQVFGGAAKNRTVEFQAAHGLTADGVVGPTTARALWRVAYVRAAEAQYGIPSHYLGCMATQESANDPVAEGWVDPEDEGLYQWHLPYMPHETLASAWTPSYVIPKTAESLAGASIRVGSWQGAVAAHNCGEFYAKKWVQAGYPSAGLVVDTIDWYARATLYVHLVEASAY